MTEVRKALRQAGVSPKIIADALVSIVGFVLAYFAVSLDPVLAAAVAKLAGTLAAWLVGPGDVVVKVHPVTRNLEG